MKQVKPPVHTFTTARLIADLKATDPAGTALVSLAGSLRVYRVKRRGDDLVDIEAAEAVSRDPHTGAITVAVLD